MEFKEKVALVTGAGTHNTGQALSVKSRETGLAKREQPVLKYRNGDGYRVEYGMTKQANRLEY